MRAILVNPQTTLSPPKWEFSKYVKKSQIYYSSISMHTDQVNTQKVCKIVVETPLHNPRPRYSSVLHFLSFGFGVVGSSGLGVRGTGVPSSSEPSGVVGASRVLMRLGFGRADVAVPVVSGFVRPKSSTVAELASNRGTLFFFSQIIEPGSSKKKKKKKEDLQLIVVGTQHCW